MIGICIGKGWLACRADISIALEIYNLVVLEVR